MPAKFFAATFPCRPKPHTGNPGSLCRRRYGLRGRPGHPPSPRNGPPSCQYPIGHALRLHRFGARRPRPRGRYSWHKNSALTHPSYLNKDLTSSAASSPWTTPRSPPCYHSTAESPRRLDLTAAPFWTRARLNRSSIKEPLTKWSPWVPLTRLASDPPHPELGAGSDPDSCSARTNRPE